MAGNDRNVVTCRSGGGIQGGPDMNGNMLEADCTRCAALCCIALAFSRSDMFGFDKDAGIPCPNLDKDHRCTIHKRLKEDGFSGCIRFDCVGAGQRVTQELFGGRSWRDDPEIAVPMFDAFRVMRQIHDLLLLLVSAQKLPLLPWQQSRLAELQGKLHPENGWSLEMLDSFEQGGVAEEVRSFLQGLREQASVWAQGNLQQ